jgi:hypothetical protein
MKTKISIAVFLFVAITALSFRSGDEVQTAGAFKYVGVTSCVGACHKSDAQGKQLDIWQNSQHSKAFKTLQTPEADAIAKEKGFDTPAAETEACLKCHVLGKTMDPSEFESSFSKEDGVQCESCHGPGSEYKKLSIMKDRSKAVENGLMIHENSEGFCTGCHNSESPTFKGFSYEEYWAKIKHSKP